MNCFWNGQLGHVMETRATVGWQSNGGYVFYIRARAAQRRDLKEPNAQLMVLPESDGRTLRLLRLRTVCFAWVLITFYYYLVSFFSFFYYFLFFYFSEQLTGLFFKNHTCAHPRTARPSAFTDYRINSTREPRETIIIATYTLGRGCTFLENETRLYTLQWPFDRWMSHL